MSASLALAFALAANAPAHAAEPAAVPAWLQVERRDALAARDVWETLSTAYFKRYSGFTDDYVPTEDNIRMRATRVRLVEPDGELAGDWTFLGAEGASRPHAGFRLRWDGGSGYRWIADLHCDPGAGCEAAQAHLATLPAPRPPDPAQRQAWIDILATEPCQSGAPDTRAPLYPSRALRLKISGVVVLGLLVNRCGDVRDAWVQESSRTRELDDAAVEAARRWKLEPPEDGVATATARVPITFSLPDD